MRIWNSEINFHFFLYSLNHQTVRRMVLLKEREKKKQFMFVSTKSKQINLMKMIIMEKNEEKGKRKKSEKTN